MNGDNKFNQIEKKTPKEIHYTMMIIIKIGHRNNLFNFRFRNVLLLLFDHHSIENLLL